MQNQVRARIYTYWAGTTLPDYAKKAIENNLKINKDHDYVLCYDEDFIPTEGGWSDFIAKLKQYHNFKMQEINGKDIFNPEESFLPTEHKRIMHSLWKEDRFTRVSLSKPESDSWQSLKKDCIQSYVLRNKNTVWLDADCICSVPITLDSRCGYKQSFKFGNALTAANIVGSDNTVSFTLYLMQLDVVNLSEELLELYYKQGNQKVADAFDRYIKYISVFSNVMPLVLHLMLKMEKQPEKDSNISDWLSCLSELIIFSEHISVPPVDNSTGPADNISTTDERLTEEYWEERVQGSGKSPENYIVDAFIMERMQGCPNFTILLSVNTTEKKQMQTQARQYDGDDEASRNIKLYLEIALNTFFAAHRMDGYIALQDFSSKNPNYQFKHTKIELKDVLACKLKSRLADRLCDILKGKSRYYQTPPSTSNIKSVSLTEHNGASQVAK